MLTFIRISFELLPEIQIIYDHRLIAKLIVIMDKYILLNSSFLILQINCFKL